MAAFGAQIAPIAMRMRKPARRVARSEAPRNVIVVLSSVARLFTSSPCVRINGSNTSTVKSALIKTKSGVDICSRIL